MENYLSEIIHICKLPLEELIKDFKAVQIGRRAIYICNYNRIIDYSLNKIVLKSHENTLEVSGDNLQISQLNKKEIVIRGDIYFFGTGVVNDEKHK